MGRKAVEKFALQVGRLRKPGMHFVGGVDGLALQILPSGGRSWILRMTIGDKRRDMGLGGFPDVTLATARDNARKARALVKLGIDPIEEGRAVISRLKAAQSANKTFEECAIDYKKAKEPGWKNGKHSQQWINTLQAYAFPLLGSLMVRDIELPHVMAVLEPIWFTKTVTADRLRGRIEAVLDWAKTSGYRVGENPARWRGHLSNLLPEPNKIKNQKHHPAVTVSELGPFMDDLRTHDGMSARALEFCALTAARSGEVRGAVWSEIDVKVKVWTVPAERMKGEIEHRKPLSDAALELILKLPRFVDNELVFPSPRGGMLSDMSMSQLMRRMDYKAKDGRTCVPHGLRSTFRDWAAETTSFPSMAVEFALAHNLPNKTEAAYFRSDLLDIRYDLMDEWAKFCAMAKISGDVKPLSRVKRG